MDYSTLNKSSNSNPRLRLIYATGTILVAAFFGWVLFFRPPATKYAAIGTKAVAVLSGDSKVTGVVTFTQTDEGVTVSGTIRNLDPNSKRGFHVHQLGDLSNGCTSAGSHFNPLGKTHGAPADATRHAGDLGNIQSNNEGIAEFSFIDTVISLSGEKGIVGRSVVVHAGTDDLGKGGNEESLKTGNAGGRAACGVIGLAELS